jgi:N-acyl-L-homoserine lactone synthetase
LNADWEDAMGQSAAYVIREAKTTADIDLCARVRADVFCAERGMIPEEAIDDGRELDDYDSLDCVSFLATDDRGIPVGTIRILFPGGPPLPIEKRFGISLTPTRRAAEVSRLAVSGRENRGEARAHLPMLGLCRAVYDVLNKEVDDAYAIMEPRLFSNLTAMGYPFIQLGDAKMFDDDPIPTIPTLLVTQAILPSLLDKERNGNFQGLKLGSFYAKPFDGHVTLADLV